MNNNKTTKVLEFSASWCAPCRAYAPIFERVSKMEEFNNIKFESVTLDDGENHDLEIGKYDIKSVPTTILLDENNDPIYKLMGSVPEKDLVDLINKTLDNK